MFSLSKHVPCNIILARVKWVREWVREFHGYPPRFSAGGRKMSKLTVKEISSALPEAKDKFLEDGEGLRLRIFPSGKKSWQFRYQINGTRKTMSLGSYEFVSLKEARLKAHDARKLIDQGIDPAEQAKQEESNKLAEKKAAEQAALGIRTLGSAIERWAELELVKRKDPSEALRALRKDIITPMGDRDIQTITRGDILDAMDTIINRGARRMANRTFSDLKQFFRWAHEREWVATDPIAGVTKDRVGGAEPERERFMDAVEIIELAQALPKARIEPYVERAIWIMLSTLCRVGEITQARWTDINLEKGEWVIPADIAKNGKAHTIYLSDFAQDQFAHLRELSFWSEWVMPSPQIGQTHINLKTITRSVRDRIRSTPLKNRSKATGTLLLSGGAWTPHDLRRSGATMMAELGVLSEIIERCLNHVEMNRMKRTYQRHEYRSEQKAAWQLLGNRLEALLKVNEAMMSQESSVLS